MKKTTMNAITLILSSLGASVALASGGGEAGLSHLGAAIAIGLGAFGAATAQGKAAAHALEGFARNPGAKDAVFMPLIVSLVFMETQALFSFVIAIMLVGK